jgi:metal-sulfur cluster biosynthetic enzyme
MVTKEEVMETLKQCYDPEIPVNVVDLGFIHDVQIDDGKVSVKMILTAPGCPMRAYIAKDVKQKLEKMDGIKEADVEIVMEPRWTPDRISPEARVKLGIRTEGSK